MEVSNDSRCPSNVTCIWTGFAQVKLDIQGVNGESTIELATEPNSYGISNQTEFEGISIKLVDVTPYPAINVKINPDEFRAILLIEKVGS